jgi:hypothetical protein
MGPLRYLGSTVDFTPSGCPHRAGLEKRRGPFHYFSALAALKMVGHPARRETPNISAFL